MRQIDMTGRACPLPVVEAKKALAPPETQGIVIKVDNKIAVQNLEKMASSRGYSLSFKEADDGSFDVTIQKGPDFGEYENNSLSILKKSVMNGPGPIDKNLVVVIGSDTLGRGEEELGKILMKSFIYSLSELDIAPVAVIFMNRGAYLSAKGSNTVSDIKRLEEKGAEILTCGTCANYYNLTDSIEAGAITDMYKITEIMAQARSVINI